MKIDASVIQRLSQGDREAYTAVFREYYAPLVVYSSRIVKEREIAEDIVQEFFCYLWKQRRQLAEMHSFTTYLYRSIHNRLLNYLRDRRGIPIEDQDMLKEDDFVGRMMEEEVYRELYDAVRRLPARCRDIFNWMERTTATLPVSWISQKKPCAANCAGERKSSGGS